MMGQDFEIFCSMCLVKQFFVLLKDYFAVNIPSFGSHMHSAHFLDFRLEPAPTNRTSSELPQCRQIFRPALCGQAKWPEGCPHKAGLKISLKGSFEP